MGKQCGDHPAQRQLEIGREVKPDQGGGADPDDDQIGVDDLIDGGLFSDYVYGWRRAHKLVAGWLPCAVIGWGGVCGRKVESQGQGIAECLLSCAPHLDGGW